MEENYAVHPELMKEMYPEQPVEAVEQPQQAEAVVEQKVEEQPKEESSKAINLRILRERAEKAEREKEELIRLMMEKERQSTQRHQPVAEEEDELDLKDDDYIDAKHFRRLKRELKETKELVKNSQYQSNTIAIEAKLKAQYPDFDQIVNTENIKMLNAMDPVLANLIGKSSDLYEKAAATYNMIKKFNIHKYDKYEEEEKKIKENLAKPRSLTSINPQQGDSPLSKVNIFAKGLTKEVKEMLNREMEEAIKNKNR